MRVEGVEVEFPADVAGAVGAQDVEGEGAEPGEVARFGANAALVFEEADIADVMASVVSRPEEFHLRPLAELCVKLSPHTAPIRRTRR